METTEPMELTLQSLRVLFQKQLMLSVEEALGVIHDAQRVMAQETNMVHVPSSACMHVIGDIHGQFFDLMRILDDMGAERLQEEDVKLVFLGDYVDRGAFSCEVMLYLLLLKVKFPSKVVLLRGNHECETISAFYGFRNECRVKYGISVYYHFLACFQSMPIAALLETPQGRVFCVHGGLSPNISKLEDIEAIDRHKEVPTDGPLCDLLWSDPAIGMVDDESMQPQWTMNRSRGCSYYFNAPALFSFLEANGLLAVIRAHEFEDEGFRAHFQSHTFHFLDQRKNKASFPPLLTVFSAPNYCDQHENKAGYLTLLREPFSWEIKQIQSVGHPAPSLDSSGRGPDIWKRFNKTLSFLPASKEFFEIIRRLADKKIVEDDLPKPAANGAASQSTTSITAVDNESLEDEESLEVRRRQTYEMHPRALRKVLDEEASKWIQSSDEDTLSTDSNVDSTPIISLLNLCPERSTHALSDQELEMLKLTFSLLDTNGSMTLTAHEISQFIHNVLGERVSRAEAESYLKALDFDRNGVVDFSDVLSWAVVIKTKYLQRESDISLSLFNWQSVKNTLWKQLQAIKVPRAFLWITIGWIMRDMYFLRLRHPTATEKGLRLFGYVAVLSYTLKMLNALPSAFNRQE